MRILHIIPSVSPRRGGASKAALDMVRALRSNGVDAEIACTNDDGPKELPVNLGVRTDYAGVPVTFFKRWSAPSGALREFSYSGDYRRWLTAHIHDYDLIHVHGLFSFLSTYTMWVARRQRVAYIAHPIGTLEHWSLQQSRLRKAVFLALVERKNLHAAARVHFTASSERDQALATVANIKPMVIPLGLDLPTLTASATGTLRTHYKIPDEAAVLLFLGRIHPKKGLEKLLAALTEMPPPGWRLLIAGDGEAQYLAELKALVKLHQLGEQVRFIGFLSGEEKQRALQGADLFVLTSHSENFGIAVLEALAAGTAVLISNEVALSEQVIEHQLGAATTLEKQQIVASLSKLLATPAQLTLTGLRGRDYVAKHHNWGSIAAQLSIAYQQVLRASA